MSANREPALPPFAAGDREAVEHHAVRVDRKRCSGQSAIDDRFVHGRASARPCPPVRPKRQLLVDVHVLFVRPRRNVDRRGGGRHGDGVLNLRIVVQYVHRHVFMPPAIAVATRSPPRLTVRGPA